MAEGGGGDDRIIGLLVLGWRETFGGLFSLMCKGFL